MKQRRKGKVLGTRQMGFWMKNWATGVPEYYHVGVSAYVNFPKFMKGRKEKWDNSLAA